MEPAAKARREDVQDNQQALSDLAETLQLVADHFENSEMDYYIFFEDDMFFYTGPNNTCKNGFNRKTKKY